MHRLSLTGRITSVSYATDKILVCNFTLVNNETFFLLAEVKQKPELEEHLNNATLITVHGNPASYGKNNGIWAHDITLEE